MPQLPLLHLRVKACLVLQSSCKALLITSSVHQHLRIPINVKNHIDMIFHFCSLKSKLSVQAYPHQWCLDYCKASVHFQPLVEMHRNCTVFGILWETPHKEIVPLRQKAANVASLLISGPQGIHNNSKLNRSKYLVLNCWQYRHRAQGPET